MPGALRVMLGLGCGLAVGATLLVVFTTEVRWLRFAVLLSLWAALIAAFAVARFRSDARDAELRMQEGKRVYELELQREISARREYEQYAATMTMERPQSVRNAVLLMRVGAAVGALYVLITLAMLGSLKGEKAVSTVAR